MNLAIEELVLVYRRKEFTDTGFALTRSVADCNPWLRVRLKFAF